MEQHDPAYDSAEGTVTSGLRCRCDLTRACSQRAGVGQGSAWGAGRLVAKQWKHSRVCELSVLILLGASPAVAAGQDYRLRSVDRGWLGCWTIVTHDTVPDLAHSVLIRLDSMPTYRGPPPSYYGVVQKGAGAVDGSPFSLSWAAPSVDSLAVSVIGLGGYGWLFQQSGDSLVGMTYQYYDVVPERTRIGRASAHRSPC